MLTRFSGRELAAAVVLLAFGAFVIYWGREYPIGTATQMGPGYVPRMLGIAAVLLGLVVLAQAFASEPVSVGDWSMRPGLAVTAAVVLFALLVDSIGLVAASLAVVIISRLAASPYRPTEVAVLGIALSVITVSVFIHLLKIPMRVW